jgi:methylmalonyl-CoA mutase N-terminal domain/subunit
MDRDQLKPVYTAADVDPTRLDSQSPGEYPYTRGIQPTMYRGRLWTMRQYAGMGDAEESNKRYHYLLAHGTSGLSVAFDLPTQTGYDSDSPLALGEVGRVGVAISSLEDMERLFSGIRLDLVSTSMTINATASTLLAMYVAAGRRSGADVRKLTGTVQNDILKEYIARGTYIYPVIPAMRLTTDLIAWAGEQVPQWNTISISGYHMREAGCTAAQELLLRWPMGAPTSMRRWERDSPSTALRPGSASSSTPIRTSSKRWASFAPRGASGRAGCGSSTAPPIRARGCCASTRRPPVPR